MSSTRSTLPLVHSGKIRELYALPDDRLLLLATDKVSAYDHVLPTPIPGKGAVLTQLTTWWLAQLDDLIPTHLVSTEVPDDVAGRALVVERLDMIPVECVVRGYLAGSGWKEYSESGTVAGLALPEGLQRGERLERPIFTPAAKAPQGSHDENITFSQLVDMVGEETALELRRASLRLYVRAERIAREHGLVLVDTKFEFGRRGDGTLVLADEVLTPDSSRYWALDSYAPGTEMPSLDKQQLRDWLTNDSGWDPDSDTPAPELPEAVVTSLSRTYADTYRRLTGGEVGEAAALDGATAEAREGDEAPAEESDAVPYVEQQPGGEDYPAERPIAAPEPAVQESPAEPGSDEQQGPVSSFIVDVMLREDIPDAQGASITETLRRLGYEGMTVRQGKRFEVDLAGALTQERIDELRRATEALLVNIDVEDYEISLVGDFDDAGHDHEGHDHEHHEGHDHSHDHADDGHEHGPEDVDEAEDRPDEEPDVVQVGEPGEGELRQGE
ncbi:MAG TPA: phosphoribosylaminoimidazolesuccinocarboxamide synthase [Propionibacteriaceae bacterium]|nr:phosphoribosylaminoimidazolesuccinocarboxamide synthase [Propionibacteriaceae bacterium]